MSLDLDRVLDAGDERRDKTHETLTMARGYVRAGAWWLGWALAKLVVLLLSAIALPLYGIGWLAARAVPVLRWLGAALALGFESGRGSGARGERRGA